MARSSHTRSVQKNKVKGEKKKDLLKIVLLVSVILAVITSTIAVFLTFFYVKDIKTLNMDLKVGPAIGFNLDTDAIHFGTVGPGRSSEREVIINHAYNFPMNVVITTTGNISDFVYLSENDFVLDKGESKTLMFKAFIPPNTPLGNYSGTAKVVFTRKFT